ncbi:chymotrypsinogen A-like [Daphnia carinata]|uniref:chymotrypsinogen A-like n=1 Tax=Daphnia carinata TaxID=120202 RepID=UPI0028696774|nr:chymotrypsinogen A-like [Daphnia carinata]
MAIINRFASMLVLAAIVLLGTVNGRIYQTSESIIFEIERTTNGAFLAKNFPFIQWDFMPIKSFLNGGVVPNWQIPLVEPTPQVNSHSIGLPPQHGPTFYSWLHYPFVYGGAYPVPTIGSRTDPALKQESKQNIPCGAGPARVRIVNGQEAAANSWPFMVAFTTPDGTDVSCGGSLISETKILTVAHCFEQLSMYQVSQMVVKLGMHKRRESAESPDDAQMTRRIGRLAIHKAFNAKTYYNDIAVVTMDTAVAFSKSISPVCLAPVNGELDVYAGETATIMGWGTEALGGTSPANLKEATVTIITNEDCRTTFTDPGAIPNHMLCASTTDADSCQHDGGGPLVVKTEDGLWTQAGIVSWGEGCADPAFPAAVYTRVNWLRGWINGNLRN